MSYYNLDQTQAPQGMSTLKQVAVIVPCFVLGCVGALALTSPNAAVQNNVMRAIPTQAATAVAATAAAAMAANPAMAAASAVDTFDFRSVKSGYDIIYEARDLDLPQGTRDGLDQARDSATAKARIAESAARLDKVGAAIEKQYWVNGREELRRFLGTLRFDINTLAATSPPSTAKKLLATKKDMFDNIDKMDFAMRSKNQAAAAKAYDTVVKQMATFL